MGRAALPPLLIAAATAGNAIIIRHDKADQLYRDLANNARYAAVGMIEWTSGSSGFLGTGNYIGVGTGGKKWLVTAAHNLNDRDWTGKFTVGGRTYDLESRSRRWVDRFEPGIDDLGVVRILDPDNTLTVAPALFWHNVVPVAADLGNRMTGTVVGFGKTGNGNNASGVLDKLKRAMQNRVDGFNVKFNGGQDTLDGYSADFDKNNADSNRLDKADFPAANFEEGQKSDRAWLDLEGITDEGDSGGGLFVDLDGRHVMIGLTAAAGRLRRRDELPAIGTYGSYTIFTPFNRELGGRVKTWTGIGPVPEPATGLALAAGIGLVFRRRMR